MIWACLAQTNCPRILNKLDFFAAQDNPPCLPKNWLIIKWDRTVSGLAITELFLMLIEPVKLLFVILTVKHRKEVYRT